MAQAVGMSLADRIKFYCESSRRSQTAIATQAGISLDYLALLKRGARTPSVPVLQALAKALGVQASMLLAEPDTEDESLSHVTGPALARAMMTFGRTPPPETPDLRQLRERVTSLWTSWQTARNRISVTAPLVPPVLAAVGEATRAFPGPDQVEQRRASYRLAADLFGLVRAVAKYTHRNDLMLLAADRGVQCAEQADDPLRLAGATWNLAQAMSMQNGGESAIELGVKAIEDLEAERQREGPEQAAAWAVTGSLHQLIAVCEGRTGDVWAAMDRMRNEVLPITNRVGEFDAFYMVFGPANALLHMLAVRMESGQTTESLHIADQLDVKSLRSVERRASYLIDLARTHEMAGNDQATLLALLKLEREAPDDLRSRGASRELVRTLLHRARPSFAPEVADLGGRMGLVRA